MSPGGRRTRRHKGNGGRTSRPAVSTSPPSSTASTSARSTFACPAEYSSRSPPTRPASPLTKKRSTLARTSSSRPGSRRARSPNSAPPARHRRRRERPPPSRSHARQAGRTPLPPWQGSGEWHAPLLPPALDGRLRRGGPGKPHPRAPELRRGGRLRVRPRPEAPLRGRLLKRGQHRGEPALAPPRPPGRSGPAQGDDAVRAGDASRPLRYASLPGSGTLRPDDPGGEYRAPRGASSGSRSRGDSGLAAWRTWHRSCRSRGRSRLAGWGHPHIIPTYITPRKIEEP